MTKTFENDLNEKLNSEKVPMYITQNGCLLTRKTFIETNWLFANYGNYHSDEEFHELSEKLDDINDALVIAQNSRDEFEREYKKLKSQLQQQALPVVPECVGNYIEECKENKYALNIALDLMVKEYASRKTELSTWVMNNQEQFAKAWFGKYEVEKPQLFYLKHIDMSKADKECDWYLITDCVKLCHEWVGKNLKPKDDDFKFTQQEIASMQTGSYEQIEVKE